MKKSFIAENSNRKEKERNRGVAVRERAAILG
jgi:hypothetical protein